jgi:zinc and cadmium transporter
LVLEYILASVIIISLISFTGILALSLRKEILDRLLFVFVSFATGTLLGAAFLDLIPEALEYEAHDIMLFPLLGILSFFALEKFIHWHHHHAGIKEVHSFTYLNLIGDGFHNFIDGIVIAASFLHSVPLGITTTVAIIFHEIPQEIGDFSLLIHGGLSHRKALLFNFGSALIAVAGGVLGFFFLSSLEIALPYLLAFTAGHFIYIAATDILPELIAQKNPKISLIQLLSMTTGIALIWVTINLI